MKVKIDAVITHSFVLIGVYLEKLQLKYHLQLNQFWKGHN